jgi:DNA-binding response OmpR family regulator
MKILILGDNMSSIELLKMILLPIDVNIPSTCLLDHLEWMIFAEQPEIILLDLTASPQDACQICSRIHSITSIPVIVLSVLNEPQYIASILNAGADDFITKPASYDILTARINKMIRRVNYYSQAVAV